MIVHLVLFRPRPDLHLDARASLLEALATAFREIPSIRRARIGQRLTFGRAYEAQMRVHYSHAAVLEFDDTGGLQAYLDHPAHHELATRFFQAFEEALIYDFKLEEGEAGLAALAAGTL